MIQVGKYNELKIIKIVDSGAYLGNDTQEILLPGKWIPKEAKIGDVLNVFIYRDSEDRLIATTLQPYTTVDTFAYLEVKEVNTMGAFLDWGLEKDLLVPFSEQASTLVAGKSYVFYVYIDNVTNRIIASSKLNKFIERDNIEAEEGDVVDLLIYSKTDKGYNAIINNMYVGLIYENEIFEEIRVGDRVTGYIKKIREDNKIDLSLQKSGYELVDDVKWKILNLLKQKNGFLPLNDNSTPEEIKLHLQISKKAFKKAIGGLYKEKLIALSDKGINLISSTK